MDQMDKFLENFTKRQGFARGLVMFHFPQSSYLLNRVQLPINEMEDFWGIAFNEAEEGTSLSAEDCWPLNQRFDISVGQKKEKFWYQVAISECELEKLSQVNNNTIFSNCDENYKIIKELKDVWTDILFQIPGFKEALFKMVSATIAYNELPLSEQSDYHPLSLEIFEATHTIKKIANNVDQKLFEFTKNPIVFESYSLYLPLLSKLGIQVTVTLHQDKILVHEQIAKLQLLV